MTPDASSRYAVPPAPNEHRRWLAGGMWAGLALLLVGAGVLTLGACGLSWPGGAPILAFCPAPEADEPDPRLAALLAERDRQRALEDALAEARLDLVRAAACPVPEPPADERSVETAALPPEIPRPQARPEPPPAAPEPAPPAEPPPEPRPEPQPEPAAAPPPPGPEPVERCNESIRAAGRHDDLRSVHLGPNPGWVTIDYNMYRVPDYMEARHNNRTVATTTTFVPGRDSHRFFYEPDGNEYIRVYIGSNPRHPTRWTYRVSCPQ